MRLCLKRIGAHIGLLLLAAFMLSLGGCEAFFDAEGSCADDLIAQCPVGSNPMLDSQSSSACSGALDGDLISIDGVVTGSCQGSGSCQVLCQFETPCQCGVNYMTRDKIVCNEYCSGCTTGQERCSYGDLERCENGQWERLQECGDTSRDATCQLDHPLGPGCYACNPGEQKCSSVTNEWSIMLTCNPDGLWEKNTCGLGNIGARRCYDEHENALGLGCYECDPGDSDFYTCEVDASGERSVEYQCTLDGLLEATNMCSSRCTRSGCP